MRTHLILRAALLSALMLIIAVPAWAQVQNNVEQVPGILGSQVVLGDTAIDQLLNRTTSTTVGDLSLDINRISGSGGTLDNLRGGVQLTHSNAFNVANTLGVCGYGSPQTATAQNSFLRVFDLNAFGITGDLEITSIAHGVGFNTATNQQGYFIYTLEGALLYSNLTQLDVVAFNVAAAQQATVVEVALPTPVVVPAGSTLVVELYIPDSGGAYRAHAGFNEGGQTAPTYWSSESCGATYFEPVNLTAVGAPATLSWVMAVYGNEVSAADPPQASVSPSSLFFSMAPDEEDSQFVTLSNLAAAGAQDLNYSVTVAPADAARAVNGDGQIHYAASESLREAAVGQSVGRSAMQRNVTSRDDHTWWLTYINETHTPTIFTVTPPPDGPDGYVHGTNGYGDTGKATAYTLPFDQTTGVIHGVDIAMIRELPQSLSTYNVVIRSGTSSTGPQTELYSQTFNVSNIPVDAADFVWHEFTTPVTVGATFFVSVEFLPPYNLFDLAVVSTQAITPLSPYEWERWDNMAWNQMSAVWQGSSWHMYKFVEVELPNYTPPAITVAPLSGSVAAGSSVQLEVTANSDGLAPGTYEYLVQIATNDPVNPVLTVDVELVVTDSGFEIEEFGQSGEPDGWRMLSSPALGATVQDLANASLVYGIPDEYPLVTGTNPYVGYDGAAYVEPTGLGHALVPGKGFIWYLWEQTLEEGDIPPGATGGTSTHSEMPFPLTFSGSPVVLDYNYGVVFEESERAGTDDGWYLIGNPYTSAYNVGGISTSSASHVTTFQHWNPVSSSYELLTAQEAGVTDGFFMELLSTPTFPLTVTFGEYNPPIRDAAEQFVVSIELSGELTFGEAGIANVFDHVRVLFSEEATDGRDMLDAGKLSPLSQYWANIAMMGIQGDELVRRAIESRPLPLQAVTIPMAFSTYASGLDAAGTFTITLANHDLGSGWQVSLTDLETGETVNMLTDSYTFSIEGQPAIDADQRFEIIFTPPIVSGEGSGESYAFGLEAVWPNPTATTAQVAFTLEESGEISLDVFDVLGRRVIQIANGEYAAGRHVLPLSTSDLASGIYVVRLTSGTQTAVQRVTVAR